MELTRALCLIQAAQIADFTNFKVGQGPGNASVGHITESCFKDANCDPWIS